MKRDTYLITYGDGKQAKAYAWNSALRKVERLMREIARAEGCFYNLCGKGRNAEHTEGFRTWSNGLNAVTFNIKKVQS
jgi:hypothetical protein